MVIKSVKNAEVIDKILTEYDEEEKTGRDYPRECSDSLG